VTAINPANASIIRTYEENSAQEVADKVKAAHQAFLSGREMTFPQCRVVRWRLKIFSRRRDFRQTCSRTFCFPANCREELIENPLMMICDASTFSV